jgi:2-oxoisovalerate dehydrogenase E1 component alpha subunit
VHAATQWAADRARANHGATVIEFFTYRAAQHSTSDDPNRYRPADEAERWPLGDPVKRLQQHLTKLGEWSDEQHEAAEKEAVEQVRAAGREAEAVGTLGQSRPSVKEMFEDVFKEPDWRLRRQRQEVGV